MDALSIEKILLDHIDSLKREVKSLRVQNKWLREMFSQTSNYNQVEINPPEEMVPIGGVELPSERKSRLTKKYFDIKKKMDVEKETA